MRIYDIYKSLGLLSVNAGSAKKSRRSQHPSATPELKKRHSCPKYQFAKTKIKELYYEAVLKSVLR